MNLVNGDGCSSTCEVEVGFSCATKPNQVLNDTLNTSFCEPKEIAQVQAMKSSSQSTAALTQIAMGTKCALSGAAGPSMWMSYNTIEIASITTLISNKNKVIVEMMTGSYEFYKFDIKFLSDLKIRVYAKTNLLSKLPSAEIQKLGISTGSFLVHFSKEVLILIGTLLGIFILFLVIKIISLCLKLKLVKGIKNTLFSLVFLALPIRMFVQSSMIFYLMALVEVSHKVR